MRDETIHGTYPLLDIDAWQHASIDDRVFIADGHNVRISVRDGQLSVKDGPPRTPRERRISRLPRSHDRLVIVAGHGFITIEAQRWLRDAQITWSLYDLSGVLVGGSPAGADDARLRRAQSHAVPGDTLAAVGHGITQTLIAGKLGAQANICTEYLAAHKVAASIRRNIHAINAASDIEEIRAIEGGCAAQYWQAWAGQVTVPFSARDRAVSPPHWVEYLGRTSYAYEFEANRSATDPINACLNYAYRIGESEAVHACQAFGLDPALGLMHADKPGRDSMALDLLETIRPACDRIVLDLMRKPSFDRRWVSETRGGVVRIDTPLTHHIASYAAILARVIFPYAEHVARVLAGAANGSVAVPKFAKSIRRVRPVKRLA